MEPTEKFLQTWLFKSEVPYFFINQSDRGNSEEIRAIGHKERDYERTDFMVSIPGQRPIFVEVRERSFKKKYFVIFEKDVTNRLKFAAHFGADLYFAYFENGVSHKTYWFHPSQLTQEDPKEGVYFYASPRRKDRDIRIYPRAMKLIDLRDNTFMDVWPNLQKLVKKSSS